MAASSVPKAAGASHAGGHGLSGKAESTPLTSHTVPSLTVPAPSPPLSAGAAQYIHSATGGELAEEALAAAGTPAPHAGEMGNTVSSWLSSLLSTQQRDTNGSAEEKMQGMPGAAEAQMDAAAPAPVSRPTCYNRAGSSGLSPPVSMMCASIDTHQPQQLYSQCPQLSTPPEAPGSRAPDVDFTPIQFSLHNGVQLGNQPNLQDQGGGMHSGVPAVSEQVFFAGPVMDRNAQPEQLMHGGRLPMEVDAAGRQVVTDERTGQLHVLVQDLHQLKSSPGLLPVKVEGKGQFMGLQRNPLDMRSVPVGGIGGTLVRTDQGVALSPHGHDFSTMQQQTPKTRWKPNQGQLTLLERHFNSGYTKPTPELFAAVKSAGEAKEAQVSVWLKNRLARSKRQGHKPQHVEHPNQENGPDSRNSTDGTLMVGVATGVKRTREEMDDNSFENFHKLSAAVMGEVSAALAGIQPDDVASLAVELISAGKICCYGVGREKLVMNSFVARLRHLGLNSFMVGEVDSPVVSSRDVMLASAGPSFYNTVNAVCLAAIRAGTRVIAFTAHQTAPLAFADRVIRIPTLPMPTRFSKNVNADGAPSSSNPHKILQLGSAFEITLWMMFECIALMIQKRLGVAENDMLDKHTNLE